MPYALCPMPYALCPLIKRTPDVTEKGYIYGVLPSIGDLPSKSVPQVIFLLFNSAEWFGGLRRRLPSDD